MEKIAVEAYRQNSGQAREQLIESNLGLVARIVSSFSVSHSNPELRENLNSAGIVGLIEAVNAFNANQGTRFTTFAYPRIHGAIVDELRKSSSVSQRVFTNLKKIRKAIECLNSQNDPEEIAKSSGLSLEEVAEGLEAMKFINPSEFDDLGQHFCPPGTHFRKS